jgi:hypothetical protein
MPGEIQHVTLQFPLLFGGLFRNQLERADNTVFSVADGASKRPGTEFVSSIITLPTSGGSGVSEEPSVLISGMSPSGGEAASSCTPGDYASTYELAINLAVKIPDPLCTSTTCNQTGIVMTQHASRCLWSGSGAVCVTPKANIKTRFVLSLNDTPDNQWGLGILILATEATPTPQGAAWSSNRTKGGLSPVGSYSGTQTQGDCTTNTWQFDLTSVSIS